MADVFISYSSLDRAQVERIASGLRKIGLSVWFDANLTAGNSFSAEIEEEIRAAHSALVCWTPNAVKSQWVQAEANIAREAGKLVCCRLAPCQIPLPFNVLHTENLADWHGEDDHHGWRKTVNAIAQPLGRRPPFPDEPIALSKPALTIKNPILMGSAFAAIAVALTALWLGGQSGQVLQLASPPEAGSIAGDNQAKMTTLDDSVPTIPARAPDAVVQRETGQASDTVNAPTNRPIERSARIYDTPLETFLGRELPSSIPLSIEPQEDAVSAFEANKLRGLSIRFRRTPGSFEGIDCSVSAQDFQSRECTWELSAETLILSARSQFSSINIRVPRSGSNSAASVTLGNLRFAAAAD